ncbi:MAG: outer rane assembly lipoprotein YfiO [Acidobacteria bacterium]|nr:outer rane assembly lipoprotein YfiO [Acidobacteriota bacterium]
MQRYLKFVLTITTLAGLIAGVSGCGGSKGAKLQSSVIPPDKTLFQNGQEFLDKSQYINARLAFQTLIRTYPGSEFEAEAYLATGDSFYQEGGTENLLMAEDQYRNFIIFFPTHLKAPDAQMKIISILMRQMNSPDRDQGYARRAEVEIEKYLMLFPDNDYTPIVKQWRDQVVRESLAMSDFGIGEFYAGRGNPWGAVSRFEEIIEKYPQFSRMDEAYFRAAQTLELMQAPEMVEKAAAYLNRIVEGYPFSRYYEDAKAELTRLGKPIPEVNTALAAQHESYLKKPEPFNPLQPLISFAEAIGFKGPPDRFKEAQRTVAETRAQAEAAAAQPPLPAGAKPGDVLINATIEKGPDGKAVVKPNGTLPATDKKDEKKQDDPKKTKK